MRNAVVHRCGAADRGGRRGGAAGCSIDGRRELDDHPLLALLARPNPRQAGGAFLEALYGHLLVAGNAYVEAVEPARAVRELHAAAARPDEGGARRRRLADGLRISRRRPARVALTTRTRARLPPILHLTLFHPLDDHYGLRAARGRGDGARHPQCRGALEQGAARQFRAALRRAGL